MTIDPSRLRRDLERLVGIPSITGDEVAIQETVAELMVAAGLEVARIDADPSELASDSAWPGQEMPREVLPVVAGTLRGARPGPRVLLVGHVDVVPAGDERAWTTPPFRPVVRDGDLYGRGACDMKAGVAASLEAVRSLDPARLAGEVVVVTVPSEEDGGAGSLAAIRAGLVGDMAVIAEPTELEVVVAHAGAITFTLDVPGRAAHASTPTEGVSALDALMVLVDALRVDEQARNASETHPLMRALGRPYPTIVGKVSGGEWASTVLDRVVAEGRYGVRLGQDAAGAEADLRRAITAAWEADPFLRDHPVRLEITGARFDSGAVPADHPLPVGLADAAERVTGARPGLVGVPYGADMRLFINEGDTPCVMYGPGDVRHAHAADEHVPLAEVETCAAVLADWLRAVLGSDDTA